MFRKKNEVDMRIKDVYTYINAVKKYWKEEIDSEHNRISALDPRVEKLEGDVERLTKSDGESLQNFWKHEELLQSILSVLVRSGVLEEAVSGDNLFQLISTEDRLRRYPLYRINKVATIGKDFTSVGKG